MTCFVHVPGSLVSIGVLVDVSPSQPIVVEKIVPQTRASECEICPSRIVYVAAENTNEWPRSRTRFDGIISRCVGNDISLES